MEPLRNLRSDCGQFILPIKILQKLPKNTKFKLLDVGAGEHLLEKFLPENIEYHSLDCVGKQDFVHSLDEFPIPIKSNSFDIIVCLETLEHALFPHKIMKELLRISKPDTLFLLSMPNEYNFYCRFNFLFGRKTYVQKPFKVIEEHQHIQLPRVQDILKFYGEYIKIEAVDYQWYSRTGGHSSGLKGKFFVILDKIITKLALVVPSLFTRTVVVVGKRR